MISRLMLTYNCDTCTVYFVLKSKDKTILYAVACILVNCTNSYDKKEIIPEMVQLAKFSKQHVPEQHPKVHMKMLNIVIILYINNDNLNSGFLLKAFLLCFRIRRISFKSE